MGIFLRKHNGEFQLDNIGKIGLIGLTSAIASALVATIWAVYLNDFLGDAAKVGLVSAFLTLIAIASYFISIPLVEKSSKSKLYLSSLIIFVLAYALFSIVNNFWIFLALAIIINLVYPIRLTSFGLIVKDKSSKKKLTRNEGLMYTFGNIAWIIGPLIAGYIATNSGNKPIFLISSIFLLICIFIVFISKIKDDKKQKKVDVNIFLNIKEFFKNKERVISYIIGIGPSFWWSLIYLFMPLYIIKNNLSTLWIGYFLFAIPIPLILLEYKFSKKAEKFGFKRLFQFGFLIAAISAIACFFISNVYIVLPIMILASIGLAMLEPTTETYFFKVSSKEEEQRFYGPYNTRVEVGGLLGKLIPSILILFLPFKSIFLVFGIAMILFGIASFKTKNLA